MSRRTKRKIKATCTKILAGFLAIMSLILTGAPVFANEIYPQAQGISSGASYALKNKSSGNYLTLPGYFDVFPDAGEAQSLTVYQGYPHINDQYSRTVRLNYDSATGKYTLRPLLFENIGGAYVGVNADGGVELQTAAGAGVYWVISYDASKGGYVFTDVSGKALTAGSGGAVTTATYTGANTQIWIAETMNVSPHMIKNSELIEKKNIGYNEEWIFMLRSSEMETRNITSYDVLVGEENVRIRVVGNYVFVKMTPVNTFFADDAFAIIEITVDGYEKRTVVVQNSGTGNGDGCRTFPLAYISESKVIEIDEGQQHEVLITFSSGVGNVNIVSWEIIDEFDSIVFANYNGKNIVGNNFALIRAVENGFAVVKATAIDGFVYSTAIEVKKYGEDGWVGNDYVIDIATENITEAAVGIKDYVYHLVRTSENFNIWQTNFDEALGYHPGTLISYGYDYAVVSAEFGYGFILTASTNSGRELPITVTPIKDAIIILPGAMGSNMYADEKIVIPNSIIGSNEFEIGEKLWAPEVSADLVYANEKALALAMDSNGNSIYKVKVQDPIINNPDVENLEYGGQDVYRSLYSELYNSYHIRYGYDIILLSYDWRKDPYHAAQDVDAFITSNNYSSIVLVGHSMGGIVASHYIALGETQRSKIEKFISVGTPFLGSVKILNVYATGAIIGNTTPFALEQAVMDVAYNMPSVYAMLPSYRFFDPYVSFTNSEGLDNITASTFDNTMDILEEYMPNWNKSMADAAIANSEKLFLSNGKHITTLVDSYYIVGDGNDTMSVLQFKLNEEATKFELKTLGTQYNEDYVKNYTVEDGDGTVLMKSLTVNESLDGHKVFVKEKATTLILGQVFVSDHTGMISGKIMFNMVTVDLTTVRFISKIIDLSYLELTKDALYDGYRITRGYGNDV